MRPVANESALLLPLGRPSNLCAPSTLHSKLCALASGQPMPHAPCHRRLAANWAGGKDDIVMTPARWRCEISEAFAPGHLPVHSSPPTASAGLALPQSQHLTEGPPTTVSPRYLPAICPAFPAFPHAVAIVEAHQMRRPRPHLWASLVWLLRVSLSLPRPRRRAPAAQPGQARPGTRRHDDSRPHFAEIQISQNPTGWAPQRSLAPRTCRRPLPVCLSPSQSPSHGALPVPQCCRGSRYYCTAERPWLARQISNYLVPAIHTANLGQPCHRTDTTVHSCDIFHPRHGLPDAALNSGLQERPILPQDPHL